MPEIIDIRPPEPQENNRKKLDAISATALLNKNGQVAHQLLELTGELDEEDVMATMSDERFRVKVQNAVGKCLTNPELEKLVVETIRLEDVV